MKYYASPLPQTGNLDKTELQIQLLKVRNNWR